MKKTILLSLLLVFTITTPLRSQNQGKGDDIPVLKEISGFQEVKKVIPQAIELLQVNEVWHKVLNKEKEIIGYCFSSKPYSEAIKGYHGATPVIIILDKEKIIRKIAILSHYETQSYVEMLKLQKFFASWEGLTIREALNVKASVDSYSGATITAVSIRRNIDLILRKAYANKI